MSIIEFIKERDQNRNRIDGLMVGLVTNNQDPKGMGRVKVKIPSLSGEDESNWARVATPMAGKEQGIFFLPEVDTEVLVGFEYGDINKPYIIGSLWNGVDKPPETNSDGKNNIRSIKSRSGHTIQLVDKDGDEAILIMDKTGKNLIQISTKDNIITISSEKDIELSAPKGKVVINAQEVEIKASSSAKIEASSGMDLKASGDMTIKGATINLN